MWGFCFEREVKIQEKAVRVLNKIANNLVVYIVNNVVPFMIERQVKIVRVEHVLKAVSTVYTFKGHLSRNKMCHKELY